MDFLQILARVRESSERTALGKRVPGGEAPRNHGVMGRRGRQIAFALESFSVRGRLLTNDNQCMRQFAMSSSEKGSQVEVLRQISLPARRDCVAHIRALVVHDDGLWKPGGGRIDISRPDDRPSIQAGHQSVVRACLSRRLN